MTRIVFDRNGHPRFVNVTQGAQFHALADYQDLDRAARHGRLDLDRSSGVEFTEFEKNWFRKPLNERSE